MATSRKTRQTATATALILMLGVMSACSSSGLSLVPADLRASIAAEDAKDGTNKVSVDEILSSARDEETNKGGETVFAKTRGKFASIFKRNKKDDYSPAFQPAASTVVGLKAEQDAIGSFLDEQSTRADSVVAKTSKVDTINTASVSAVAKSSNSSDLNNQAFAERAEAIREKFDERPQSEKRQTTKKRTNNLRIARNSSARNTARAGDGGLTNAQIAKDWVETGPDDLAGLPVDGFDDETSSYDAELVSDEASADVRFADYLERTQGSISNERDYERNLEVASKAATYEQDATDVFKRAQRLATQTPKPTSVSQTVDPVDVLARSKALSAQNKANKAASQQTKTNDELLARARALVSQAQPAAKTTATLVFDANRTELSNAQKQQFSQFIAVHQGKALKIEAGLGTSGSTFEKLAKAQARLTSISAHAPALKAAEQKIKPDLTPDTIRLSVKS